MNGNHAWYAGNRDASGQRATPAVLESQRIYAVYPMAAAVPTHHVARHINNMSMPTHPPSFVQPELYAPQGNPPPYSEYAHQVQYMGAPAAPSSDGGYWDVNRNNATRYIGAEAGPSYPFPRQSQEHAHTTSPFAHSVFQQMTPLNAYPTPPPQSSRQLKPPPVNSLMYALGGAPADMNRYQPSPPEPMQSPQFFDDFLAARSRQLDTKPQVHHTVQTPSRGSTTVGFPPRSKARLPLPEFEQESPDPLALTSSPPKPVDSPSKPKAATFSAASLTPKKRKSIFQLESPSIKRVSSNQSIRGNIPSTPTSHHNASRSRVRSQPETAEHPYTSYSYKSSTRPLAASLLKSGSTVIDCIEIRRPAWLTPQSKHRKRKDGSREESPDPLDDYAPIEQLSPTRTKLFNDNVKTSARKTGDRDERTPLEKFTTLVEDLYEAEDALPADFSTSTPDFPDEFFSTYVPPGETRHPVLSYGFMRNKLTKAIANVTKPRKAARTGDSPIKRTGGRMCDVDMQVLSRLLRILLRSVNAGNELDPFAHVGENHNARTPSKKAQGKRRVEPEDDAMDTDECDAAPPDLPDEARSPVKSEKGKKKPKVVAASEDDLDSLLLALEHARDCVVAADCALALLASDRLPKQMYSEELITTCLDAIKNHLTKIVYPFIEGIASPGYSTVPAVQALVKATSRTASHRERITELYAAISASLPRINGLLNTESLAMSDKVIIQTVYLAVEPFFVVDGGNDGKAPKTEAKAERKAKSKSNDVLKTFGPSSMRGLRLEALSLLRTVFARRQDQRSWIIEEILSSLTKLSDTKQKAGQFRLRDGRSIRTVSALLLQLIQTSSHDVAARARKIEARRKEMNALRRQESLSESQVMGKGQAPFLDEFDKEELQLYSNGLSSTYSAAQTIVKFLIGRIGTGKTTKNSNEAEYRTIFDTLVSDALAVLYWPEWPAASVLLSLAAKHLLRAFEDNASTDSSNAAKTIALDHLGTIASRIRTVELNVRCKLQESDSPYTGLTRLSELVKASDRKGMETLLQAHADIATHLCKRSSEDRAYDSARELTATALGDEIAACLSSLIVAIEHPEQGEHPEADIQALRTIGTMLKSAMRSLWQDTTDIFDVGTQDEAAHIDKLAEEIGTIQHLPKSFQPILNVILKALNSPAIFIRTKALRALAQVITSDPSILSLDDVRRAIEGHLLDNSAAVRDAAVELIGKYMVESPEVAGKYYTKIADRIADTGLSVRKRVIKLLKAFYQVSQEQEKRCDIARRIILRQLDEDDSVKDLAIKTIEELWFAPSPMAPSRNKTRDTADTRAALLSKVAIIMAVAGQFNDRQSPLEEVLHKIVSDNEASDAQFVRDRYLEVCHTLIDGLVDNSDLPGFTVLNCVKTIYLFTAAYPGILTAENGATLLPYLKNATGPEEFVISEYVLKILRASISHMPKTAVKFGHDLQATLQPMIVKPNMRNLNTLQETIACICAVVKHLTHDYARLVNLLKSCHNRLQGALTASGGTAENQLVQLTVLILIVSLLAENCDFDALRAEHPDAPWIADLNAVSQESITDCIYTLLLQLYERNENVAFRGRALQCLGFLFRAHPTLMSTPDSAVVMDRVFEGDDEDARARILRIMQEFLQAQEQKHAMQERESQKMRESDVNMEELVGNADGFADSGVASAVVQRYLHHVLDAALSQSPVIQSPAIDVLSFTVKQGLAHPLQSFPVIVALETSPYPSVSSRASALHAILHSKHASLVNGRYVQSARASYDYQRRVCKEDVRGYRMQPIPTALFQRWYSLVREKRVPRQDFLRALVKVFPDGSTLSATPDDVAFGRYMAENFASLDYKTQEEVLTVIKALTNILATTGAQMLETLSPAHLLSHLRSADAMEVDEPASAAALEEWLPQCRLSVIIAMVMLLKAHLKALYGLSEDKCSKFVVGKKSAIGDKGAVKKHERPISWERLPYAMQPILTQEDGEKQKATFLDIWNEDGVTAEPEDDFA
ncbi:hypothetical protein BD626DRAFT_502962 [Schizophyllum amplum]|uniref:Sister chromatid cohesion protein n=1 Tax=Schizophyllum amplum TaxID=97359 RepID=A0A550C8N7_9AGAR|nr:hypothetical protein BD626DRAFT_502962 [Auriculariopsis ampla]